MPQMTYYLPDGVVYAKPGEFLICRSADGTYKAYRVHNLYLVTALLPVETTLGGGGPLEFVAQSSVAASSEPEIRYSVSEFEKSFRSKNSAIESIAQHTLGPSLPERYLPVAQFTSPSCVVYDG